MRKKLMSVFLVAIMVMGLVPVLPVYATDVADNPWDGAMAIAEGENDVEGARTYWYYENDSDEDVSVTLSSTECDDYDPCITEYAVSASGETEEIGGSDDVDDEDYNFSYTTTVKAGDIAYFMVDEIDGDQDFSCAMICELSEPEVDSRWDDAPTVKNGQTQITQPTYLLYKNTTSNPVEILFYSNGDALVDPYLEVYELERNEYKQITEYDDENGRSFYGEVVIQPGQTRYFKVWSYGIDDGEKVAYNLNCQIKELKKIKSITRVVKNPTKGLVAHLEFIRYYHYDDGEDSYDYLETDLNLYGMQLEVQYTDNSKEVVEYGKHGDWSYSYQGDWTTLGNKKLLLTYDNGFNEVSFELPCKVDSLIQGKTIPTVSLGKETTTSYNNGNWSVYQFTPTKTGYYNLAYYMAYANADYTDIILYDKTTEAYMIDDEVNYDGIQTRNYLVAGKTYYMFIRVNVPGRSLKWNFLSGSNAVEDGITIQPISAQTYTGKMIEPKPIVYYQNKDVTKYVNGIVTYVYYDNIDAGTATVVANYEFRDTQGAYHYGTVYSTFNICKPINGASVTLGSLTYTGKAVAPAATVKLGKEVLKQGVDYKVIADANVNAGTRTATIQGIGKYNGAVKKTYVINKAAQTIHVTDEFIKHKKSKKFALNAKATGALSYKTSSAKIATVDSAGKVTVKKKYGVANITISAAATQNYNATSKVVKVIVTSKSTKLASVKSNAKKKATVKIKKAADAQGYEIAYSTDKNFVSGVKTTTTKKPTATLKKLKSKKTYYVKVRTFRKVSGKKLYSEYSPVKKVKVK
ncbi:MAG: hypothetical protein E7264_06345 [Lachnospiraceae bacterium]|nr:hypothetical protein [Lachnospiraceae bacterium]